MGSKKYAKNTILQTLQMPWIRIGTIDATAAAADITLGVAERDFLTNKDLANVAYWFVPYGVNGIEARLLLTTNNADADIDVWVGKLDADGNAEMTRICTLDVICGQQDANDATHHYADTLSISNEIWLTAVRAIVATDCQGRITFDLHGYNLLLFHGYGTFDEDTIVEVSGY